LISFPFANIVFLASRVCSNKAINYVFGIIATYIALDWEKPPLRSPDVLFTTFRYTGCPYVTEDMFET
jgi:hypothetical protein